MPNFDLPKVQKLLSEAGSIIEKYETISRETGGDFNVFEIAGIDTKEVRICRVLAELLCPKGRHGQGAIYLEIFLRDCLGLSDINREEIEKAQVYCEYGIDAKRRIDIVIETQNRFIPIEAKIYAEDEWHQCYDYCRFAQGKDEKARIVYLTRDGNPPSSDSFFELKENEIVCLSFAHDILGWLKKCLALPDTIRKAPIREIIIQLESTIKQFTNRLEDRPMEEMVKLLSASAENMQNAEVIADSLNKCKTDMIYKLLKSIEKGVNREKLPFMDYESNGAQTVKDYYGKRTWPGISYLFKKVRPNVDIWFRVEIDHHLFAGLCVATDHENKGWKLTEKESRSLNLSEREDTNWWWSAKWEYLPTQNEYPRFKGGGNETFYKLFDENYFDEFVIICAKRINELWKQWEEETGC